MASQRFDIDDWKREFLVIALEYLVNNYSEFEARVAPTLPPYRLKVLSIRRLKETLALLQAPLQGVDVERMVGVLKYDSSERSHLAKDLKKKRRGDE